MRLNPIQNRREAQKSHFSSSVSTCNTYTPSKYKKERSTKPPTKLGRCSRCSDVLDNPSSVVERICGETNPNRPVRLIVSHPVSIESSNGGNGKTSRTKKHHSHYKQLDWEQQWEHIPPMKRGLSKQTQLLLSQVRKNDKYDYLQITNDVTNHESETALSNCQDIVMDRHKQDMEYFEQAKMLGQVHDISSCSDPPSTLNDVQSIDSTCVVTPVVEKIHLDQIHHTAEHENFEGHIISLSDSKPSDGKVNNDVSLKQKTELVTDEKVTEEKFSPGIIHQTIHVEKVVDEGPVDLLMTSTKNELSNDNIDTSHVVLVQEDIPHNGKPNESISQPETLSKVRCATRHEEISTQNTEQTDLKPTSLISSNSQVNDTHNTKISRSIEAVPSCANEGINNLQSADSILNDDLKKVEKIETKSKSVDENEKIIGTPSAVKIFERGIKKDDVAHTKLATTTLSSLNEKNGEILVKQRNSIPRPIAFIIDEKDCKKSKRLSRVEEKDWRCNMKKKTNLTHFNDIKKESTNDMRGEKRDKIKEFMEKRKCEWMEREKERVEMEKGRHISIKNHLNKLEKRIKVINKKHSGSDCWQNHRTRPYRRSQTSQQYSNRQNYHKLKSELVKEMKDRDFKSNDDFDKENVRIRNHFGKSIPTSKSGLCEEGYSDKKVMKNQLSTRVTSTTAGGLMDRSNKIDKNENLSVEARVVLPKKQDSISKLKIVDSISHSESSITDLVPNVDLRLTENRTVSDIVSDIDRLLNDKTRGGSNIDDILSLTCFSCQIRSIQRYINTSLAESLESRSSNYSHITLKSDLIKFVEYAIKYWSNPSALDENISSSCSACLKEESSKRNKTQSRGGGDVHTTNPYFQLIHVFKKCYKLINQCEESSVYGNCNVRSKESQIDQSNVQQKSKVMSPASQVYDEMKQCQVQESSTNRSISKSSRNRERSSVLSITNEKLTNSESVKYVESTISRSFKSTVVDDENNNMDLPHFHDISPIVPVPMPSYSNFSKESDQVVDQFVEALPDVCSGPLSDDSDDVEAVTSVRESLENMISSLDVTTGQLSDETTILDEMDNDEMNLSKFLMTVESGSLDNSFASNIDDTHSDPIQLQDKSLTAIPADLSVKSGDIIEENCETSDLKIKQAEDIISRLKQFSIPSDDEVTAKEDIVHRNISELNFDIENFMDDLIKRFLFEICVEIKTISNNEDTFDRNVARCNVDILDKTAFHDDYTEQVIENDDSSKGSYQKIDLRLDTPLPVDRPLETKSSTTESGSTIENVAESIENEGFKIRNDVSTIIREYYEQHKDPDNSRSVSKNPLLAPIIHDFIQEIVSCEKEYCMCDETSVDEFSKVNRIFDKILSDDVSSNSANCIETVVKSEFKGTWTFDKELNCKQMRTGTLFDIVKERCVEQIWDRLIHDIFTDTQFIDYS